MVTLRSNEYGKSRVRMLKLSRDTDPHRIRDLTVNIRLAGEFETAHTAGDNSKVVATDTMKNTVYALGKEHPVDTIESFAIHLSSHFQQNYAQVERATVEIKEVPWSEIAAAGKTHGNAFLCPTVETRYCKSVASAGTQDVESGIDDLIVLKTARSGFSGFPRDAFTTLPNTDDRLLGTSVSARWSYLDPTAPPHTDCRVQVRDALLAAFAEHESLSVQHTLYRMAEQALASCDAVAELSLSMPNRHCLLVDLSPFGLENDNEIFMPIDDPAGQIEAVVSRD